MSASGGTEFAEGIREFDRFLENLDTEPLPQQGDRGSEEKASLLREGLRIPRASLSRAQIEFCVECSHCIGTCPVSRENTLFSPKMIIRQASLGLGEMITPSREIWSCLGCAHCNIRCPAQIDIVEFIRSYRREAKQLGYVPFKSHHGIQQSLARLQTRSIRQKRVEWAEKTGKFRETGEVFYFVGCLPYFDITFRYLDLSPLNIAGSVLKLLNAIGIEPVISNDERCCGHDAWVSGDDITFLELARWNLEIIKVSGAKKVLFSCPEGYAAFKYFYPRYFGKLPFEVMHLTDFLASQLPRSDLQFRLSSNGAITYQDPCRLGRWDGIYDPPRQLLKLVPETELMEMERTRENALCCGTSAWMECSRCSKSIQTQRLMEALQTGAGNLITACPKCLIHLTCAQSNEDIDIRVTDIYSYLVERLDD